MYPVPAPPSTSLHGELPVRAGEEEEEHKPVLKKVKDKVKKLKNAISKKSHGHGDGGEDEDHHHHGDLDEGDDGFEEDEEMNKDPAVHGVPMYESSATGAGSKAQDMSGGGGNKGAGDGSRLNMEEFDQNQANPRTDPEMETRIQQNQEFENPSSGGKTGAKEISGGGEGTKGVGDGLRLTTEKFIGDLPPPRTEAERNTGSEQNRAYESPATNVRTADNEMSRGWAEGAEGVDDGLGIIKESVEDPGVPRTDGETDFGIEQSRAHNSPATGATTGANEISTGGQGVERVNDDLGLITDDFVEDPTATGTEAEMNTRTEETRVYDGPTTGARTGANGISGVEGAKGVNDGLGMITKDFVKDQATPRTDDETNARIEGSRVHLSPSTGARFGGEGNDAKDVGDGLGSIPVELVEDPAAPKTEAETNTRTEQIRGGEEVKISPDLCRSLEAMTVSAQNDRGETELPKSANNSYTDKVSSAASKVYEMMPDAGTSVISKVKPVTRNDGEAEAVGNQSKGISIKEYITEKQTPGEDEKALSELITEARQNKKNEAVEAPRPEGTSSDESGRGMGVVGKIRETVTSFLGGGQGSPKSRQTESHRKVAEDNNGLHGRPPDAIYQEKGSNEELPSSYH